MRDCVRRADDRSIESYADYLTQHGLKPSNRLRLSSAGDKRHVAGDASHVPALQSGGLRLAWETDPANPEDAFHAEREHRHWLEDMQHNAPSCPMCGVKMEFDPDAGDGNEPDYRCEQDGWFSDMINPPGDEDGSENGWDSRLSDPAQVGVTAQTRPKFVRTGV